VEVATMSDCAGSAWTGWFRRNPRAAWEQVSAADSEKLAWLKLLRDRRGAGEFVCLPAGVYPDEPASLASVTIWRRPGRSLLPRGPAPAPATARSEAGPAGSRMVLTRNTSAFVIGVPVLG
jgi:hypothetical protein